MTPENPASPSLPRSAPDPAVAARSPSPGPASSSPAAEAPIAQPGISFEAPPPLTAQAQQRDPGAPPPTTPATPAAPVRPRTRKPPRGSKASGSTLLRRGVLAAMGGNTTWAKYVKAVEAELLSQLRSPSPAERLLVARAAMLQLHLLMIDEKAIAAGGMSTADRENYLSFHANYTRTLRAIGIKPPPLTPAERAEQANAKQRALIEAARKGAAK